MTVKLDPQGFYRRLPLTPERLTDRVTPTADVIVLCHLGVARLTRDDWTLQVDGLVERPLVLRFDDLARYPRTEVASVHQCAGSPLAPYEPTQRVCNVVWGGVRLADVLRECRPTTAAKFVWSTGADGGTFCDVAIDAYRKDLPLERVTADVLITTELNGAPLPPENGYPVRLVVPGFYGTNSVKWLTRMTLADRRADGAFTTRWYNDPVFDAAGQPTEKTIPVWAIAPQSVIVAPVPEAKLAAGAATEVWGWAWADGGVEAVEVSSDDGACWQRAELEPARGRQWRRFSWRWTPMQSGPATLMSRAIASNGAQQPLSGRRNAVYSVSAEVR